RQLVLHERMPRNNDLVGHGTHSFRNAPDCTRSAAPLSIKGAARWKDKKGELKGSYQTVKIPAPNSPSRGRNPERIPYSFHSKERRPPCKSYLCRRSGRRLDFPHRRTNTNRSLIAPLLQVFRMLQ